MAGESARESARRQRAKAQRLLRSAEMWERGADGEAATAQVLQTLPPGWVVLHDLRWPGRRFANIDHVVIGPPGVFVIDSKNWSGRIDVRHDVLRQNGRQREKAVAGAADSALALAESLPGSMCRVSTPFSVSSRTSLDRLGARRDGLLDAQPGGDAHHPATVLRAHAGQRNRRGSTGGRSAAVVRRAYGRRVGPLSPDGYHAAAGRYPPYPSRANATEPCSARRARSFAPRWRTPGLPRAGSRPRVESDRPVDQDGGDRGSVDRSEAWPLRTGAVRLPDGGRSTWRRGQGAPWRTASDGLRDEHGDL